MDTIKTYLQEVKDEAVQLIVKKARHELPAYSLRDQLELRTAVSNSYDNWCESVLSDNFAHSVPHSKQAIEAGLAQKLPSEQILRTPWLIYEVVIELVLRGFQLLDPAEQNQFIERARRLTTQMVMVGSFKIKQYSLQK